MTLPTESDQAPERDDNQTLHIVRLWFGPHMIGQYRAHPENAQRFAAEMPYTFHGLRVTVSRAAPHQRLQRLPERRLWSLTVC